MSDTVDLGRLSTVPLRDVWAHEAYQFTQWMLQNTDVLSQLLGMDLELTAAEHRVGGYSLDLLGRDLQSDGTVIVENQLETTDHTHLGQLLTYAGGTKPTTIVWCAAAFRDEHRAALDWLNENTGEGIRFFGVEVAAVRIDQSRPAPNFRLIVKPNDWTKHVQVAKEAATSSARSEAYEALWAVALDSIREAQPSWTNARIPQACNWITLPFGASTVWYSFVCAQGALRVELYFGSSDADANAEHFREFETQRHAIEKAFGGPLDFDPLSDRKACRISVTSERSWDVMDHTQHPAMSQWLLTTFARFRAATIAAKGQTSLVASSALTVASVD